MTTPQDSTLDLMFDRDITIGVVGHLVSMFDGLGTTPAAEEYEPGMWQVRLDPTDPEADNGWIAVAGQNSSGQPGWVLLSTVRTQDPEGNPEGTFFVTADDENPSRYPTESNLHLDLNVPIDTVASVIYSVTFGSLNGMGADEFNAAFGL